MKSEYWDEITRTMRVKRATHSLHDRSDSRTRLVDRSEGDPGRDDVEEGDLRETEIKDQGEIMRVTSIFTGKPAGSWSLMKEFSLAK